MLERRRRGAFRASAWLVRCALGCPPAIPAVPGVRTVSGAASHALQHLTHYTVHLRPGDPGHLFPPIPAAGSTGMPRPAGTERYGDASRPRCASRIRPVPRRSFRSRIRFQCAIATRPRKPACKGVSSGATGALDRYRGVGQVPGRWTGTGALDRYRGVGQVPGRWTGTGALDRYRGVGQVPGRWTGTGALDRYRGVGQVVAGFAPVQVSAEYGPELLAGLPPLGYPALGYPDPLGAEHISPRPLRSLRHRYLPPGYFRQFIATLHHGAAFMVRRCPPTSLGLRGRPNP